MEGLFRGANAEQDGRFSNKEEKLLRTTTFPACFNSKVDMKRVNVDAIKQWVAQRMTALGVDDDITLGYVFNVLQEEDGVNPKRVQIQLTPMLDEDCAPFMAELWQLLLAAQASPDGIPPSLAEKKKGESRETDSVAQPVPSAQVPERPQPEAAITTLVRSRSSSRHHSKHRHHKHRHHHHGCHHHHRTSSSRSRSRSRSPQRVSRQ